LPARIVVHDLTAKGGYRCLKELFALPMRLPVPDRPKGAADIFYLSGEDPRELDGVE
jgi:hypothetical protein